MQSMLLVLLCGRKKFENCIKFKTIDSYCPYIMGSFSYIYVERKCIDKCQRFVQVAQLLWSGIFCMLLIILWNNFTTL